MPSQPEREFGDWGPEREPIRWQPWLLSDVEWGNVMGDPCRTMLEAAVRAMMFRLADRGELPPTARGQNVGVEKLLEWMYHRGPGRGPERWQQAILQHLPSVLKWEGGMSRADWEAAQAQLRQQRAWQQSSLTQEQVQEIMKMAKSEIHTSAEEAMRTCYYCGKVFGILALREEHEEECEG